VRKRLDIPAGADEEPLPENAGALIRSWQALRAEVEVSVGQLRPGLFRLTVRIANATPWTGGDRAAALAQALVSTHTILRVTDGAFVSMTDPPADLAGEVAACRNLGTWPALVGADGDRGAMLSSPIVLPDYPRIAPESPGDLFDGTEIDQMLVLNILTLTDEEKAEVRATDPRGRAILERTEALTSDDFMRLHGAIRDFRVLRPEAADGFPTIETLDAPAPDSVEVAGVAIAPGSRVRLRPRPGGDVFDIALAGRVAIVEAIEQDYDARLHVAVTLEDDPGRDLGLARQPGHRFFFAPEEVEPLLLGDG
jgi:hydrogenase maturation protease